MGQRFEFPKGYPFSKEQCTLFDDRDDDKSIAPTLFQQLDWGGLDDLDRAELARAESAKLERSPALLAMADVEAQSGDGGLWEQHWITLLETGDHVFASVYYRGDVAIAITADGRIRRHFRIG